MKITITFKDPDAAYEPVKHEIRQQLPQGLSREEQNDLIESRMDDAMHQLRKWLEYGEYLTVEFDLEAGTATVKERK